MVNTMYKSWMFMHEYNGKDIFMRWKMMEYSYRMLYNVVKLDFIKSCS